MGEDSENWRISEVLRNPLLKQYMAAWEQANAPHLTADQLQMLTELVTCVRDFEAERAQDGDPSLEEISQDPQKWAEFVDDHKAAKEQYNRLMAEAVRNALFAYPQYGRRYYLDFQDAEGQRIGVFAAPQHSRQYYRDHYGEVMVRFGVLNEAHPLVLEWVGTRRAVGDTALHRFWPTEHRALEHGVLQPLFDPEGEADLAEAVRTHRRTGKSWAHIFRVLQPKIQRLRNKKGKVRLNNKESLRKWAMKPVEAEPPEILPGEAHEMQQRAESIQTLECTPQPSGGYVTRVLTASGDQIEAQEGDRLGSLIKLDQSLYCRWPGDQPQQGSDT